MYVIALSGCKDGLSRLVMWLVFAAKNNNRAVTTHNYINCVKSLCVIPMRMKKTQKENGTKSAIHCNLRHAHTDQYASLSNHSKGSVTRNQCIGSWQSLLRKGRWVQLFLVDIQWRLISSDFVLFIYKAFFLNALLTPNQN